MHERLARLLAVLSHPHRLEIVEELASGEADVATLASVLGIRQPGVSQHLGLLKLQGLVQERRSGRRVIYRLAQQSLRSWLVEGLEFLERTEEERAMSSAIREARGALAGRLETDDESGGRE